MRIFKLENCFKNYKELAKDLNRVYSFDLAKQVVEYIKENFGVEITEKEVYDWVKNIKN